MCLFATERSTVMESHLDGAGFRIIVPMLSSILSRQSESQWPFRRAAPPQFRDQFHVKQCCYPLRSAEQCQSRARAR